LADATGLTVRTLHHYERIGLLGAASRTPSDHRLYDEAGVERLYRIRALRALGMSLDEIGKALVDPSVMADLLRTQLARVEAEVERMSTLRDRLRGLLSSDVHIDADALLLTLDAMSRVDRHVDDRRRRSAARETSEALWRSVGEALRACMDAGESPAGDRVAAIAIDVRQRIRTFSGGDVAVEAAMARLRALDPPSDLAGWDPPLMRFLDRALAALDPSRDDDGGRA
jgi:DNA-binding transcriptional MerR regulator